MGSVNIDNTGSGADVTLSSDGTDLLLDGTAVGGSPDLYAESYDGTSTKPNAGGTNTIAIGVNAYAVNENSIAFGTNASAQGGTSAVALGDGADARQVTAVAIGFNTYADGSASVALGRDAQARADNAIALGKSRAGAASSIAGAINNNSSSYGTTGVNSVALGTQSRATNNSAASIGQSSIASGYQSAAYGYNAVASGQDSFAGGSTTDATATNSTALGKNAQATHANATAVGYNAATSATNQVALGASGYAVKISDTYTLPTSDGTANQVLTTDGSGAVTFADAGGPGGATGVDFNDDVRARWGTGNDLEIYHDSTTNKSHITETGSSHLVIQGQEIQFKNASGTDLMALNSAQVELFFNGSKKLETNTSGITTTGTVNVNGAYTLPTSDGTNGQVLTTDGSGAVTFADAPAPLELYAENPSSPTAPSATGTNALALQDGAVASANRSIAVGQDAVSSGIYAVALGVSTDAINFYGTALGYKAQAASGDGATALTNSRASGSYSFAAAIANNTSSYGATGSNSVAIGKLAKATSTGAVGIGYETQSTGQYNSALGGYQTQATGTYHSLGLGSNARSTAFASTAINGGNTGSYATADWSVSMGGGALSNIIGKFAYSSAGAFGSGATGDAQQGTYVLRSDTTDATAEAMTTNNSTAGTTNQVVLPNNSAYSFSGTIVARQQASAGTASAAWKVEGLIRREGSAGTTVLVNSATTVLDNTPGWGMALSADTTNGGLKVEATGAASTNIRWVATIHTSEVTYA